MNYDAAIDNIRDERLEMVENIWELKQKLLETLEYFPSTQAIQELPLIIADYYRVRENILAMITNLNSLEDELIQAKQMSNK